MIIRAGSIRTRTICLIIAVLATPATSAGALAAAEDSATSAILQRLEALESQNHELARQIEELQQENEAPQTRSHSPDTTKAPANGANAAGWQSRIGFNGDFRFRHENIDDAAAADERTRETIRARLNASVELSESIHAEIGFASGGRDPRGGSSTLGASSSRKETGLDLAYVTWHPTAAMALTAGKMRQPFVRPGASAFIDNEIRPEGLAVSYQGAGGVFGSAFRYWLEERPAQADSTLLGGQLGWGGALRGVKLKLGAGYYDYGSVQGRVTGFGGGLLNELGNSVIGSGASGVYRYDYDIAQLFAQADFAIASIPLQLFADYARNSAADDGLDTAYNFGFLVGKANSPGRWEFGLFRQKVEKDALFGQWIDSDFAGGVTDNEGYVYRIARMVSRNLLINVTYLDTAYNVDVGSRTDYQRLQLDFNFAF